ncbi:MAG: CCA tRNA nucleotidyltransferase [Actinobacteria bacterium]|nr:CCA tRNA nucleotidyltransferase [Actinomycetota bacterium]
MEISLAPELEAAVRVVGEPYEGVYLVGGTVRDILLGRPNFDVDIAVEGDGIEFAHVLAAELGGSCLPHGQFGTAVVLYGEGQHVDVVTARRERYASPGALPTVEPATIKEDLFRRDFTINAMAVWLKADDRGRLVDPFDGRTDLEAAAIRVLHDQSFIDDPTRIFRAVRYENRYGFCIDEHTEALARACIEAGHVGDLSGARVRDELTLLLEEADAARSIERLGELGLDKAIHPRLAADEDAATLFARLRELDAGYELDVPSWRLGLAALARHLAPDEASDWLARLKLRRRDAQHVASAIAVGPHLVEQLRGDPSPAEIVSVAEPDYPDAPLFALGLADLAPLHAYFGSLRDVRLDIDGSDLAELGLEESPRVGEVLAELRRRKLNGELDGRESELAAARELMEQ